LDAGRSTVFERLAAIRQNDKVDDYTKEFEMLVSQALHVSEEQLLGYFFVGVQINTNFQNREELK